MVNNWKLNLDYLGRDERDFCYESVSKLCGNKKLDIHLPASIDLDHVDILSPGGDGNFDIQPYSRISEISCTGDILVFLEPDASSFDRAVRQRCWHNEMILKKDGHTFRMAYNVGNDFIHEIDCFKDNLRCPNRRGQFHLFRPSLPSVPLNDVYEDQVAGWITLFSNVNGVNGSTDWAKDGADIVTIEDLRGVAGIIVRKETKSLQPVTCAQWASTIIQLALTLPLNDSTMDKLGVLNEWRNSWRNVPRCEVGDYSFNRLPLTPYSKDEFCSTLAANYLGVYHELSSPGFHDEMVKLMLLDENLAQHYSALPPYMIAPSFPLWDYRHPRVASPLKFEYVATIFPDDVLSAGS